MSVGRLAAGEEEALRCFFPAPTRPRGAWPDRGQSPAEDVDPAQCLALYPTKGDTTALACRKSPEKGRNKTRNQRESARSTVFFNTNLTTTKPLHETL